MNKVTELKLASPDTADAAEVLAKAGDAGLQDVIIIGYDANGEFYSGSSVSDGPRSLWLLAQARVFLEKGTGYYTSQTQNRSVRYFNEGGL